MAKEIKRIGWNEKLIMYVYVDWKIEKKVRKALKSMGWKAKSSKTFEDQNDDHLIEVTVTPESASLAHSIIDRIIR